jgi:hypothetical protein
MRDQAKIKIKGEVTISRNGEVIFCKHNTISGQALEIILRSLASVPVAVSVDQVVFGGDFGSVTKSIVDTEVNNLLSSITFITQALEEDFEGNITNLKLKSGLMDVDFATKGGISIDKDNATRIEVRWKITINNCM